jgi:hypothetical protein
VTITVHVVCRHGIVGKFTASSVTGAVSRVWIVSMKYAEWAPNEDGVERWHTEMRCHAPLDKDAVWCRFTVPVVNPDKFGPALDEFVDGDHPGIARRVSPTGGEVFEVPLALMAHKLGAARRT